MGNSVPLAPVKAVGHPVAHSLDWQLVNTDIQIIVIITNQEILMRIYVTDGFLNGKLLAKLLFLKIILRQL